MSKKTIKQDFFKAKGITVKFFKSTTKALRIPIRIALTLAFMVIPFLNSIISGDVAKCIWYPICALYIIFDIVNVYINSKTPSKFPNFDYWGNLGTFPIIIIFSSAFIINYYETSYNWWWAIFVLTAIDIPIFILDLRNYLKKKRKYTAEQQKTSLKTCWKYICFYWLIDLFYMTIFNYWSMDPQTRFSWLILQFVFGGFAMLYIFYNLARLFLSNTKKQWWGLLQDFLWGTAITVYLIFIIPDESLQNIVLAITAALYGGLLTLVGVAWTIKDTNEKRNEDLKRIEFERKEEERKKYIPYVRVSFNKQDPPSIVINANITKGLDFEKKEDLALLKNKRFYSISIKDYNIKNVSSGNIIIKGVFVHGNLYRFSTEEILEPGTCCKIKTTNNWRIPVDLPDSKILLIVSDIIGNLYKIECAVSYDIETHMHQIVTIDEEEYTGFEYSYAISSVGLPVMIDLN